MILQTKESHILCDRRCNRGLQLAHVASHEGIKAVEHIAGAKHYPIDYSSISSCIYSNPETAKVGLTEEKRQKGFKV